MELRAVRYIVFFDENKNYITGVQNTNYADIPSNAKYVVITTAVTLLDKLWYIGYSTEHEYENYYEQLTFGKSLDTKEIIIDNSYKRISEIMSKLVLSSEVVRVKLMGDSITHGVGGTGFAQDGDLIYTKNETTSWRVNTAGHCWANSLKSYFENKFNCIVKNYGCSGLNSYDYIYNDNAMLKSIVEDDDDIIIIMIGTNDRSISGRTKQKLYNHLQQIYDYVTGLGKEIIFMSGIPASVSNESTGIKEFHMEDVDHVIMKLASENNMEYISVYKLLIDYCELNGVTIDSLLVDGLHPNDIGYDVMFKLICHELGFGIKRTGATW